MNTLKTYIDEHIIAGEASSLVRSLRSQDRIEAARHNHLSGGNRMHLAFHLSSKSSIIFCGAVMLCGTMLLGAVPPAAAQGCSGLPNHTALESALELANGTVDLTLNNEMWGTVVAPDGTVCAVAHTGDNNLQSQWLASRVISAQKANTANSLSLAAGEGGDIPGLALSTANLWAAVQPGGSLFGLQHSNPVDTAVAYSGNSNRFGTAGDPMVGKRIGGVNVFGGGLALYSPAGTRVGGLGVSGDTSCRDHMVAWETRHNLGLDFVPAGVSGDAARPDNIIFDVDANGVSASGFGQPNCLDAAAEQAEAAALSPIPD